MIQMIIESWPTFHPTAISLDFEVAVINAFSSAFPNATLQGCLFHLVQNIRRKLVDEGLISRYNKDVDFALKTRMIAALAFVPIEELERSFGVLSNSLSQEFTPILDYFEDYYIGRMLRNNVRRQPLFNPAMWSCYLRTINNECRTNNFAEAAHRKLNEFITNYYT